MQRPDARVPVAGPEPAGRFSFVVLAALIPCIVAGGLITLPLDAVGLRWPVFVAIFLLSLLAVRRARWRTPLPWTFIGFWVVLAAWFPVALDRAPQLKVAHREVDSLIQAGLLCVAVLLFTQGRRRGLSALRVGWVLALALSCTIATWELITGHHLWTGPQAPWPFADPMITAGTFINPNNFAGALTAMVAGTVAMLATSRVRVLNVVLAGLIGYATVIVFFTGSRSGLAALGVVLALEVWRRVLAHLGDQSLRVVLRRHAKTVVTVVAAGALIIVAVALIPTSVISRNPVRRLLFGHFDPATAKSDELRAQLIDAAFRYLRESHYLGSGAGSFEPLLNKDPRPIILRTNLHNAFVELLTQYGVIVGAAFVVAFGAVVVALLRSALARRGASPEVVHDQRIARHEAYGYLTAFVAFGVSASSALGYATWWLSFAAAAALAWWLTASRSEQPLQAAQTSTDEGGRAGGRFAAGSGRDDLA